MFESILGHAYALRLLRASLERRCFSQAYLFYGEEGIGKRTVGRIFAKALLCPSGSKEEPECDSCRKFEGGTHPDYLEIGPEGAGIKIGQVRALQEGLSLAPLYGERRIYLFNNADRLSLEAANALLKTLEEPPSYVVLILIAHRLHLLPDTLRSRCQKLPFRAPSPLELEQRLIQKGSDPHEAQIRVEAADGNPAEILSLDAQQAEQKAQRLGRLTSSEYLRSRSNLFALSEEFGRDPEHFRSALRHLSRWLRDLRIQTVRGNGSEAPCLTNEAIDALFESAQRVHAVQNRNINRQLALDVLLSELREQLLKGTHRPRRAAPVEISD